MITEIDDKIDFSNYEEFLKNENSTFYHSSRYLHFLKEILHAKISFVISKEKKELKGILPFFVKESVHGKVVNSLPFFGSYGGIISKSRDAQKQILERFNDFNEEAEVLSSVIISNPFASSDIYDKFYKFNAKEERLVQCADINKTPDTLWESLEQRVRRAIRKSQKKCINVKSINLVEQDRMNFYQMHKIDMESKGGRPKPLEFFKELQKNFVREYDYDVLAAYNGIDPIAYLLVFYFHPFTEYYMPAYRSDSKHLQGTSLLIWESMKISMEKRMKYYNFGGTGKTQCELYMFKKGWNATDYTYNYYIYSDMTRIKGIGVDEIKKHYQNFYVSSYDEIAKTI